jgi:gp178
MNKQELFEAVIELPVDFSGSRPKIDKLTTLELIKLLKEPEKVKVPQFVADWYEEHKDNLEYNIWDWMKYNLEPKKRENVIFSQWLGKTVNNPVEILIKMKLYGYEVEQEKRYMVKMKGLSECYNYLNYDSIDDEWYFTDAENGSAVGTHHTRKKFEDAGFGEVFNSPLFEIEEVE